MGQTSIAIHEDVTARQDLGDSDHEVMSDIDMNVPFSDVYEEFEEEESDEEDEVDETVADDMHRLEQDFKGISQKYRLINRIGEGMFENGVEHCLTNVGTFSTVYKAEQLEQPARENDENENPLDVKDSKRPAQKKRANRWKSVKIVALKKIYVTSSPSRILNELELLHELRDSPHICPLLTAFRHQDQVVAVLPYFRHLDFRLYFRDFLTNDLRHYFLSLFSGLQWVHKAGIIHRDIKPTNFLYSSTQKHGVLVDFGLAERQGTDWQQCVCLHDRDTRKEMFLNSYAVQKLQQTVEVQSDGYPKNDSRPTRRANRAGTRGFRAPEVLLKCTAQTTKIDMWSVGVILLTLLGRRFPFFNSSDDVDALIEIASIFGKKKMQGVAAMHGSVFETNIPSIGDRGFNLEKIVLWASCRDGKPEDYLHPGECQAVQLLEGLLELDPKKRLSAQEALDQPFFTEPVEDVDEKEEREEQEAMEEEERLRKADHKRKRAEAKAKKVVEA